MTERVLDGAGTANPAPANGAQLPQGARDALVTAVALALLLGFAVMAVAAVVDAWTRAPGPSPYAGGYVYTFTALATLVGGICAVAFGQAPPQQAPGGLRLRELRSPQTLRQRYGGGAILTVIYVGVYILCGVAAIGTWALRQDEASDLLKNFSATSFAMFLAIARGYLV
jgi:hypothetical protein